jgi:hypothetical protein
VVGDVDEAKMLMLRNYYNLYASGGINVNARHFEICAKAHTDFVKVRKSSVSSVRRHSFVLRNTVLDLIESGAVEAEPVVLGQSKVVQSADFLNAMTYERLAEVLRYAQRTGTRHVPRSTISKLAMGVELAPRPTFKSFTDFSEIEVPVGFRRPAESMPLPVIPEVFKVSAEELTDDFEDIGVFTDTIGSYEVSKTNVFGKA